MKIFDKLKLILIPIMLMTIVISSVFFATIKFIKDFFVVNYKVILLSIGITVFVVPIIFSFTNNWEISGILIAYDFIFGFIVLSMLVGYTDRKYCDGYNGEEGYNNTGKTYINNWKSEDTEKRKNGGLTDKEVQIKKLLIRKKLEKNRLLDKRIKEKITADEQVIN